ncbi:hypothetical protein [Halomonas sp. BC04]|uniref:hypothetical protein n=1 Tax=Halomonas sp. BC04 TaxID=1403540 RepID=UPI0003ED711A|nr:hypothetical protein [Halomonas sp. BC04]EWH02192.1 hypothetical protein Q427_10075 [Halomonas sp. BC04]
MNNSNSHKHWKLIGTTLLFVTAGAATFSMATAATLPDDLEATAEQRNFRHLDDHELAGIRGRYVQGNKVLLFGMEMSTVWTSPSGQVFETRADLQVDLSGSSPMVTFSPHITATTDEAYQSHSNATGQRAFVVDSGTGNATGVVQVVQSGGDFNVAGNDFQLDINHGSIGQARAGNGGISLSGDSSGVQMSIEGGARGLGMRISVPGQGDVAQGVYAGRGLHQSVQLMGNHQEVHNMTRMQIQMDQGIGSTVPAGDLRRALESTRNLERSF